MNTFHLLADTAPGNLDTLQLLYSGIAVVGPVVAVMLGIYLWARLCEQRGGSGQADSEFIVLLANADEGVLGSTPSTPTSRRTAGTKIPVGGALTEPGAAGDLPAGRSRVAVATKDNLVAVDTDIALRQVGVSGVADATS